MIKKKIRRGSALVLGALLGISVFVLPEVFAANRVDLRARCSLQMDVPSGFSELPDLEIPVNIYKVADIAASGTYTVTDAFKDKSIMVEYLEGEAVKSKQVQLNDLANVSDKTKAEDWQNFAAAAKKAVDDSAEGTPIAVAAAAVIENGTVIIGANDAQKLPVGLYLIDAQETLSEIYRYNFQPYLISMPNNYYYPDKVDDTWVYDLTGEHALSLKPERTDLYGDLVIEKTVDVYNGTYSSATFVFQVEAAKADPDAPAGAASEKVFSDVFAISFTEPGTKSLTVGKIPAGAQVTVTEVYTGASYTVDAAAEETVIIADEVLRQDSTKQAATVSFKNTHDGRPNGGSGIVNSFSYDNGQWIHQAYPDSLGQEITPDPATGQITP